VKAKRKIRRRSARAHSVSCDGSGRAARGLPVLLAALVWSAAAMAQGGSAPVAPSQVIPPYALPPQSEGNLILPELPPAVVPAGAERYFLTLRGLRIDAPPAFADRVDAAALIADVIDRWISVAQIYRLASQIERDFVRAGYPLMRVVVPPQHLDQTNGQVRIQVIDGFIEAIDFVPSADGETIPARQQPRILAHLQPLLRASALTNSELQRRVLLASAVAGVELRSSVAAGSAPGGVRLLLDGRHQMVGGRIDYDNAMSRNYGRHQLRPQVVLNAAFGAGESLALAATARPTWEGLTGSGSDAPVRSGSAVLHVPLGIDGLQLGVSAVRSATRPGGSLRMADIRGDTTTLQTNLSYPLILERGLALRARAALETIDEQLQTGISGSVAPISRDRLTVARAGLQANGCVPVPLLHEQPGCFTFATELSQGLDLLGARRRADATVTEPLSRQGADAVFTHLRVSGAFTASFVEGLDGTLQGAAQLSLSGPLLTPERFGITGPNSLSGWAAGAISGDDGFFLRAELALPVPLRELPIPGRLSPYIYQSYGVVRQRRPSAAERAFTAASAFGGGVRLRLGISSPVGLAIEGRLEFGKVTAEGDSDIDGHQGLAALSVVF